MPSCRWRCARTGASSAARRAASGSPSAATRRGWTACWPNSASSIFFVDTHGLLNAAPQPKYGVHRPARTPGGPAAFARDYESSKQVWAAEEGYPGDLLYREFYRDAGFDVDEPHIRKLLHAGIKTFTGLKYHRITGKTDWKEPYHPSWARERAAAHAGHFMFNRQRQVEWLGSFFDRPPIIVSPYDAELFGHWWFEGPQWIDFLLRKIACDQDDIKTITPAEYLDRFGDLQTVQPPECSWGAGGFHEVWLNGSNEWVYPLLHAAAERMSALVQRFPDASGLRAGRSTRPRASCCWRSRATGRSS